MTERWKKFELEVLSFLRHKLSNIPVVVEGFGKSNSHLPDIKITRQVDGSELFWLDTKLSPAQGYQFVVQFTGDQFEFSEDNKATANEFSQGIIEHMNNHAHKYSNPGTAGVDLECNDRLLRNWIISQCEIKNVRYIVTSTKLDSFKVLVPVVDMDKYFKITARYRVKRSGSRDLAATHRSSAYDQLCKHLQGFGLEVGGSSIDGKRTIAHIGSSSLFGEELYFGDDYYLSAIKGSEGDYYIKKRGRTQNANIIFILEYCGLEQDMGLRHLQRSIVQNL